MLHKGQKVYGVITEFDETNATVRFPFAVSVARLKFVKSPFLNPIAASRHIWGRRRNGNADPAACGSAAGKRRSVAGWGQVWSLLRPFPSPKSTENGPLPLGKPKLVQRRSAFHPQMRLRFANPLPRSTIQPINSHKENRHEMHCRHRCPRFRYVQLGLFVSGFCGGSHG